MEAFFRPTGVVVVGASNAPGNLGATICHAMREYFPYPAPISAVNKRAEAVSGCPGYASVLDVPDPVDLAVVLVPAPAVPDVAEECGRRGIRHVVIESSGFAEAGAEGRALQARLDEAIARHGLRVVGPNCLGTLDTTSRFCCLYGIGPEMRGMVAGLYDRPGAVSYVIQSGGVGVLLLESMGYDPAGVRRVASAGNCADVDLADWLAFFGDDPQTKVVGLYVENVERGRRFLEVARTVKKPVLVCKIGRSEVGAKAAASHTAGMANNDAVFDGACRQAGVVRVRSVCELHSLPKMFTEMPPLRGPRVAIFTNSGAFGGIGADLLSEAGLRLGALSEETKAKLRRIPGVISAENPVDLGPAPPQPYLDVFDVLLRAPEVDGLLFLASLWRNFVVDVTRELARMCREHGKPAAIYAPNSVEKIVSTKRRHELPMFESPEEAVRALVVSHQHFRAQEKKAPVAPVPAPAAAAARRPLSEHESKRLLAAAGVPVTREELATTREEALRAAARIGYPVACKGCAAAAAHKTELGLVRLNLGSERDVASAWDALTAGPVKLDGVLVQEMVRSDRELVAGLVRDPHFGPCVMFGVGGVLTEVFRDVVFRPAPLTERDALEMLDEIRARSLLGPFRGQPAADRDALARVLVALGELALRDPGIVEVDVNPLLLRDGRPVAVDALVVRGD